MLHSDSIWKARCDQYYYEENYGEIKDVDDKSLFSNFGKTDFLEYQLHLINVLAPLRYNEKDLVNVSVEKYKPIIKIVFIFFTPFVTKDFKDNCLKYKHELKKVRFLMP